MSFSLPRLRKSLQHITLIQTRIKANQLSKKEFVNPPSDFIVQLRQAYIVDANVIAENLDLKKTDPLRQKYPDLFKNASGLHGQCAILDHKYEVAGVQVAIDWNDFWTTLTDRLPNTLGPLLESAIEKEESIDKE